VGYAGLGEIGLPMAARVLHSGFELYVWNRTAAKAAPLIAAGARVAATPADLAQQVAVLCVCLTDERALEQVIFGADGVASAGARGLVVADHSTVSPAATREMARRFEATGGHWVDAPVSGGVTGAQQGTLSVFAGGAARDVERARPVVMCYAGKMTHLGPTGSGQAAKACNQMVSFGTAAVLAEALHLASRLGLDVSRLPEALEGGLADSAVLRRSAPRMLSGELVGSTLTCLKDLEIILELGRQAGAPLPMTGLLASLHRMLVQQGQLQGGMAAVIRLYAEGPLAGASPVAPHASSSSIS
jgi:3-hydroxyisobutyrate dehydrogenase